MHRYNYIIHVNKSIKLIQNKSSLALQALLIVWQLPATTQFNSQLGETGEEVSCRRNIWIKNMEEGYNYFVLVPGKVTRNLQQWTPTRKNLLFHSRYTPTLTILKWAIYWWWTSFLKEEKQSHLRRDTADRKAERLQKQSKLQLWLRVQCDTESYPSVIIIKPVTLLLVFYS